MSTTVTWTLATDWTIGIAKKIKDTGDILTLRQYLETAEVCDDVDTTNAWGDECSNGGTFTSSGGEWKLHSGDASSAHSIAQMSSQTPWALSGNFDIQIDFSDLTWTPNDGPPFYTVRFGAGMFCRIYATTDNSNRAYTAIRLITGSKYYEGYCIAGGVQKFLTTSATSDTSGKIRLTRTNTDDITTYYWNGSSWTQIATTTSGFSGNVYIWITGLHYQASNETGSGDCDADNLTLNSGTMVNGYYKDSPTVALDEADSTVAGTTWDMSTTTWTAGGTGSIEGRYKADNASGGGTFSAWLTLAQLQAEVDPTGRYFNMEVRLVSNGTQTATCDVIQITNDYTAAGFVPYPLSSRGARGGLLALSGGLAA